jgi:hypothetical protein
MSWLTDLLKEYPAVAVVKERLEHEANLHEATKAKNAELQLQVDELTKENERLKAELTALRKDEEFENRGGLLYKKGTGAGPYCPVDEIHLVDQGISYGMTRWECPKCGFQTDRSAAPVLENPQIGNPITGWKSPPIRQRRIERG